MSPATQTVPAPSPLEARRKRARFRSWHRGIKEGDLLLGRFADRHVDGFDDRTLDLFEALLDWPDQDIVDWVTGRTPPPPDLDAGLVGLLLADSRANPPV